MTRRLVVVMLGLVIAGCGTPNPSAGEADPAEGAEASTTTTVVPDVGVGKHWTDDLPTFDVESVRASLTTPAPPDIIAEEAPETAGEVLGRIVIPNAPGADVDIVLGTTAAELDVAAGLMTHSVMPGQWGNSAVAAHRTTFGAWFHNLDLLVPGDLIYVETDIGTHTYAVVSTEIVDPKAWWTVEHRDGAWITLIACHPKGSNAQRIIVFGALIDGPNFDAVDAMFHGGYAPPQDPRVEPASVVQEAIVQPPRW